MITTVSRRLLETAAKNNVVKEDDSFQVDLRVHGRHRQRRGLAKMTKIQTSVDKLQDGYRTTSIINELGKKGKSNTFRPKHRGAQSKNWAKLDNTSWERFPKTVR